MGTRARAKFSHSGGVVGRRVRALKRLKAIKKPTEEQLEEIKTLEERTKGKEV